MSSSFFGFTIGVKALSASQKALEVISHNVANINTEGYKKQEVVLTTTMPEGIPAINRLITAGQLGSGVEVSAIRRLHDHYIERELNKELQNSGKWEQSVKIFENIESIFNEPTENGLREMMDLYWNSWRELENFPENYSVRKNLVENSKSFCNLLKSTYQKLINLKKDLNTEAKIKVEDINNLTSQIKQLNSLIKEVVINGDSPNDLMDKRDLLINQLSKLVNIDLKSSNFNQVNIFIGGTAIVRENNSFNLEANLNAATGVYDILWKDTLRPVDIENGELFAILNFRDNYIPDILKKLDDLAGFFIENTNLIHSSGYGLDGISTGYNFFSGTGVLDFNVNSEIDNNLNLIAAAATPNKPGDNLNVSEILNLRDLRILDSNSSTSDEFYNNMIIKIGVEAQQCVREGKNSDLLINKINLRKESVSGVSLDEELVNMLKFQHSYNAAAKVISTMDSLFETIIKNLA